ncbi:MAG: hypothetical protein ACLFPO_06770 [Spirochaetaceae bacterium]
MTRSRIATLLLILSVLSPATGFAQRADEERTITSRVDWLSQTLHIEVHSPLPSGARSHPAASHAAEQRVRAELSRILQEEAGGIRVDSLHTLDEHYGERPRLAVDVARLSERLVPTLNRHTPDLRALQLGYSLELYPTLAELFVEHERPAELRRVVPWRPSMEFTGLVVYARGQLPVYGEDRSARVRPALFPDIYSHEASRVVLETDRVQPQVIRTRGPVAYATSASDPIVEERAGTRPMRTVALGVFGRYATDPIISAADAEVFFAEPANREIIHEGRVVIVIEESVLEETELD